MSIRLHRLKDEDWEITFRLASARYLHGECFAFALALHYGLGWDLVGIMRGDTIIHAVALSSTGRYFDVRGVVPQHELGEPFGLPGQCSLKSLQPGDLVRPDELPERRERAILQAMTIAEQIWPDLPWKNSHAARVKNFLDEIERVSRKYGLWIRPQYPGVLPVIDEIPNDECWGYDAFPIASSRSFMFNRTLLKSIVLT